MSRTTRSYYGFDEEKPWKQGKLVKLFGYRKNEGIRSGQVRCRCRFWKARGLFENMKFEVS